MSYPLSRSLTALAAAVLFAAPAFADEAQIRKNLPERVPNLPAIDEVTKTPIPGLYEVRIGTDIMYVDETATYVLQGNLVDARTRTNMTEARIEKLTAFEFDKLPLKDAIVWKSGNGARKMVVFADPNCGYCKRLEGDIQKLKNVTVYTFLVPVLGPDSAQKSKDIWCAKDQAKTWINWMVEAKQPPKVAGNCTTPLERNSALAAKHRVNGTPALVFSDSTRVPGAIGLEEMEKRLAAAAAAKS